MTHSPAEVVQQLLIQLGLAEDPTTFPLSQWPVYYDNLPDRPDDCIAVNDVVGRDFGRSMVDGSVERGYGIKITVRSATKAIGWLMTENIKLTMEQLVNQTTVAVGGFRYLVWCFTNIGPVLNLGNDGSSRRLLFTINALLTVRQTT